jgi:ribonuclease G
MANNDLIIDSSPSEVVIALLNDKKLVELNRDKKNAGFAVGDIYLGRIKKVMPGLNAAFVDVGYEKDAFLHYLDLGSNYKSLQAYTKYVLQNAKSKTNSISTMKLMEEIDKSGKINDIVASSQQVLVQIAKEPISNKGPRITAELSLAGRYVVLVPFSDKVSMSQKIKDVQEKDRLRKIIQAIRPKNFGVIVRTVAENKGVEELESDLKDLIEKWNKMFEELKIAVPPKKVLGEMDRTSTMLRDLLNSSFNNIHVNDEKLFEEIKQYLTNISPENINILKLYKNQEPIFDFYGVDRQIKASFGKTVNIKHGAYLIIEHTEAMHVIDVNSGHRQKSDSSQEVNALDVNMEAAIEVARQLRLRDMGGIIVIDFIDMHSADNRKLLFDKLKEEMKTDRAKHTILPPTKFGLVQITRQRVRPEMNVVTNEKCPTCNGTGEIMASVLIEDEIENNLKYLLKTQKESSINLTLHPFLAAYFTKGIFSKQFKWWWHYKKWVNVKAVKSYSFLEYRFFNDKDDEIRL